MTTAEKWDNMSNEERWAVLRKTDLRGLQKCNAALQPFRRLSAEIRDKIWIAMGGDKP